MGNFKLISILTMLVGGALFASCDNDIDVPDDNDTLVESRTPELQAHNGEIYQYAYTPPQKQFAGAGYDIMARYCSFQSVKGQVIDLAKLKKGTYSVLRDEVTTVPQSFVGRNAIEFLKAIERSANFKEFVPAENSDDLLFTGTVAGGSFWDIGHAKSPVDYSSQYTFALLNNNHIHSRQVIDTQLTSLNESLFTEDAQYYLQKLSADNIVHLYGTHVIVDAVVGLATNAMFRSVNLVPTDESIYENAYYYASKLANEKYSPTDKQKRAIATSFGTTTAVEFKGGDYYAIPMLSTKDHEVTKGWSEESMKKWLESGEEGEALVELRDNGLVPLYSLISDPTLRAEIKEATIRHIKAKQLEWVTTTPLVLYKEIARDVYHFNTVRLDCEAVGVLASLFTEPMPDTQPLYLHSNEDAERLLFGDVFISGMLTRRIIGYCYNKRVSYDCDELIEITDGTQFRYSLNGTTSYNEDWKETGVRIYTKRINMF